MIRKATREDIAQLQTLNSSVTIDRTRLGNSDYEAEIQASGFLLGTDDPHSIEEELTGAYSFLVSEEDNKILGYLIADHREEQRYYNDEYKTWFDDKIKQFYHSSPQAMSLATIATDVNTRKKGVATELLMSLEETLRKNSFTHLFSIVSLAPLTNCSSLLWHTKNGFRRLAMGKPRTLFGLGNYSAILFYKELK